MDDDDESFYGQYEEGHWEWDEKSNQLIFISDFGPEPETFILPSRKVLAPVNFKDDLDHSEQQRFRKGYQRKLVLGDEDIVTLQDVIDVILFTAPQEAVTTAMINILHLPVMERFLRALILFCQYFLQISEEMSHRILQLQTKIPTKNSELLENIFQENLEDVKLLVAKEYCTILIGGRGFRQYHHMGPSKQSRSLAAKDVHLFENLIRFSVQIVWLALGRKSFNQIEVEVHRLFKSETFNPIEHQLRTNYISNMLPAERRVLLGDRKTNEGKLRRHSPLMNEVFAKAQKDYRMLGVGYIKFPDLPPRLQYFQHALSAPEEHLVRFGVTLGIIGMPRNRFDIMLREIPEPSRTTSSTTSLKSMRSQSSRASRVSSSARKSALLGKRKLYPDISIPSKHDEVTCIAEFPTETIERRRWITQTQRQRWLDRISRFNGRKLGKVSSKDKSKLFKIKMN